MDRTLDYLSLNINLLSIISSSGVLPICRENSVYSAAPANWYLCVDGTNDDNRSGVIVHLENEWIYR